MKASSRGATLFYPYVKFRVESLTESNCEPWTSRFCGIFDNILIINPKIAALHNVFLIYYVQVYVYVFEIDQR